jgi:hypothetical protein
VSENNKSKPEPATPAEKISAEVRNRIREIRNRVALDHARRGKDPMHFSETMELRKIHAKRTYEALYGRASRKPDPQP